MTITDGSTIKERAAAAQAERTAADEAKAQEAIEGVRESLQIGENVDPLDALLAVDKAPEDITEDVPLTLIDGQETVFTIRALTGDEIDAISDKCTTWVKRGRQGKVKEMDNQRFERELIVAATAKPQLEDARLLQKFGVRSGEQVVKRTLLPGTYDGLATKVLELSGYTDDLVAPGKS